MTKRVLTVGKITTQNGRRVFEQSALMPDGSAWRVTDSRKAWEQYFGLGFLARCFRMRVQRTIAGR